MMIIRRVHEQHGPEVGVAAEGQRSNPLLKVIMIKILKVLMILKVFFSLDGNFQVWRRSRGAALFRQRVSLQ